MKIILNIICILMTFLSCGKKDLYPDDCDGYPAADYKAGFCYAEGSYEDFNANAIFVRTRLTDTINGGWKHHPDEKVFIFTVINEYCSERMFIYAANIKIKTLDTILINNAKKSPTKENPTGSASIVDVDTTIEGYELIDDSYNWLLITKVNADTSIMGASQNVAKLYIRAKSNVSWTSSKLRHL